MNPELASCETELAMSKTKPELCLILLVYFSMDAASNVLPYAMLIDRTCSLLSSFCSEQCLEFSNQYKFFHETDSVLGVNDVIREVQL